MGLTPNDQELIKFLLGKQLINANAVVQFTLQASERKTTFLQVILEAKVVDPAHLTPFMVSGIPQAGQGASEDDAHTVISSESQELAAALSSGEVSVPPSPIPAPSSSVPRPNSRFGPFMLQHLIGQGGMGMVFRAKHIELDRDCAVKFLSTHENIVDEALVRFTAEAKTFAQLDQHPNIVRVIDAGDIAGHYYISMELVEGMSFKERILKGGLDTSTIVRYVGQIADALVTVHKHGIIHRDIKPGNILVSSDSAKLTDFGIAKNTPKDNGLTLTGSVLGTLAYMPPEQAEDSKMVDGRADIYSLGAVLYFGLTNRAPHVGASGANIIASLLTRKPERPRAINSEIPLELEKVVLKAMARDPRDRYQDAERFRDALLLYLRGVEAKENKARQAPKKIAPKVRRAKKQSSMPALIGSVIAMLGLLGVGFVLMKQQEQKVEEKKVAEKEAQLEAPAKLLSLNIKEGQWISKNRFEVSGTLDQAVRELTIFVDGQKQSARADKSCRFSSSISVKDGIRKLKIIEANRPDSKALAFLKLKVDTVKPKVTLEDLEKETVQPFLTLAGTVEEDNLVSLTLNKKPVQLRRNAFEEKIALRLGENAISIVAIDKAGHIETVPFIIKRAPLIPVLKLNGSPGLTRLKSWTFQGTVFPEQGLLTLDSKSVAVKEGEFQKIVALREGKNEFNFGLSYQSKTINKTVTIISDRTAPKLTILSPLSQFRGTAPKLVFSMTSTEGTSFQLTVGKTTIDSPKKSYERSFKAELEFKDGRHSYTLIGKDEAGNQSELKGEFLIDSAGPEIDFDIDWKKSTKQRLALKGTIKDLSKIEKFKVGTQRITVKKDGQFFTKILRSKLKSGLFFEAKDELGNVSKVPVQFDLVLLSDIVKWQTAGRKKDGRKLQDAEVQIVAKRLGKSYKYLGTKLYKCGGQDFRIATFAHKKTGMEFNLIPGGKFLMGSKVTDPDIIGVAPLSPVKLKPFLIGRFEVKQREWRVYEQKIAPGEAGPELPMSRINWLDIAKWLKLAGDGLRLPSESEWEYACRASSTSVTGTGTDYFWGKTFDQSYVWSKDNAGDTVQPGRRHEAAGKWNAFGLIDMLGNVWEWMADSASPGYDEIPPPKDGSPYKQAGNTGYMNRGGFWGSTGIELKQWYRDSTKEDHVSNQLGARFVVSIPDK